MAMLEKACAAIRCPNITPDQLQLNFVRTAELDSARYYCRVVAAGPDSSGRVLCHVNNYNMYNNTHRSKEGHQSRILDEDQVDER